MGVDIYLKSGREDFSCRLYWVSNLIDDYRQYSGPVPELTLGKKLNQKEARQLLDFLKYCLPELEKDKQKQLAYFDSGYFKKLEDISSSLKHLIKIVKSKPIEKSIAFKFQGLIKKLENFTDNYSRDPDQEKAEIQEDFNEKISLVQEIIPILAKIASGHGSVTID